MSAATSCPGHKRKCVRRSDWHGLLPGLALLFLPKCPACLAAWLGALTGLGLSVGVASGLRAALILLCAVWLSVAASILLNRLLKKSNP